MSGITPLAASAAKPFLVADGPDASDDPSDALWIGYDADPEARETESILLNQNWAGLGKRSRTEDFEIICAATALIGDGATKPARDRVHVMTAAVEDYLRENPDLDQPTPTLAEYKPIALYLEAGPAGLQARLRFNVVCRFTRI
jgi:hypothetical protein